MSGDDLRVALASGEPVLMPGVWDPLSARLAATGRVLDVMFLSGFAVSGTLLGLPDVGYLTQTEMADAARRVCAAVPGAMVVVDADTGYGNALNVHRTVELWESAGAVGPVPRGPGVAEAVRPHGGQARGAAEGVAGQAACRDGRRGTTCSSPPAPTRRRRARPRRGDRAGPDGGRPRRRRGVRGSARIPKRSWRPSPPQFPASRSWPT